MGHMSTITAFGPGLQAALLLARGRPEGLTLLGGSAEAAWQAAARSFWAVALCLPAFICLYLIGWEQAGVPPDAAHDFALNLLGYALGWVGFAVLSHAVARVIGRGHLWPRFIGAWNWCNVIQYSLLVLAEVPALLGAPDWMAETAWLVAMGWALWLEWYVTRLALDLTWVAAVGLVVLDLAIGIALVGVTGAIT
jgi:hypothetical protein